MRAGSILASVVALTAIATAAMMAVYVPIRLFELSGEGKLNVVTAGIFSALGIIAGAVVAFFAVAIGIPLLIGVKGPEKAEIALKRRELEEKLTAYRARQRAMLEELDEIKKLLEEIRDLLKEGVGG